MASRSNSSLWGRSLMSMRAMKYLPFEHSRHYSKHRSGFVLSYADQQIVGTLLAVAHHCRTAPPSAHPRLTGDFRCGISNLRTGRQTQLPTGTALAIQDSERKLKNLATQLNYLLAGRTP